MFSKGVVYFWMLTNNLPIQVYLLHGTAPKKSVFLQGLLQHLEMGSIHPVLSGFTEVGPGAKMCLAYMHLGICDKKGCSLLTGMRCLDFFYLCVYDQKMIDLCSNLPIL